MPSTSSVPCVCGTQFDPAAIEVFVAEEATLREMVEGKCSVVTIESSLAAELRNLRPQTKA
ncbi:MAG: hypothetical protein IH604_00755 [Burkholderiales bacterium]|nr:hypothetical protein [Burkholderiales bacterium]